MRCEWGITQSDPSTVVRLITDPGTLRALAKAGGVEVEDGEDEGAGVGSGGTEEERGTGDRGVKAGRRVVFDMSGAEAAQWVEVCRDRQEVSHRGWVHGIAAGCSSS